MSGTPTNPAEFTAQLRRLLSPEDGPVIRVDAHQWTLIEYRPTGHLRTRTMHTGNAEYIAHIPETAPHRTGAAPTLAQLTATYGTPEPHDDPAWTHYQHEQATLKAERTARDTQLTHTITDILTQRILTAAATTPPANPTDRRTCRNCRGNQGHTLTCTCKDRGSHYLGVLAKPSDHITDTPPIPTNLAPTHQEPDPDCPDCRGTGTRHWTCPLCNGTGHEPACLDWTITGPTGHTTVRRDIAAMLRTNDTALHVTVDSINRHARITVRTDSRTIATYVNNTIAEGQPTWLRTGTHFQDWNYDVATTFTIELTPTGTQPPVETHHSDALTPSDGPFTYALLTRDPQTGEPHHSLWVTLDNIADILPTGEYLLNQLQQQASGNPWAGANEIPPDSDLRGADGLIERVPHQAVIKLPLEVLFDGALTQATQAGYALGLTYGFIATGQYGPSIYLLTSDDRAITEIGNDYDWHSAIAEAYARLPQLLTRLAGLTDNPA